MSVSYQQLIQEANRGKFKPVYFLAGDEPFFIDEVEQAILKNAFPNGGEEFNLDIVYGRDISDLSEVIGICRQYPTFSERRVVVVREAQHLNKKDNWNHLLTYLKHPVESTVLIVLYKNKKPDKRWEVTKTLIAHSLYFELSKLREQELSFFIKSHTESLGLSIDMTNSILIAENLGNDLSRITNELDKLKLVLPQNSVVDSSAVEKHIGISREYNTLELSSAIEQYNLPKAIRIIDYFSKNPKSAPFPLVIGLLYSFFSKLWLFHTFPQNQKQDQAFLNKTLGGYYRVQSVRNASKYYNARKSEQAIAILAEYDLKSKGLGSKNISESELMLELVYKLMN